MNDIDALREMHRVGQPDDDLNHCWSCAYKGGCDTRLLLDRYDIAERRYAAQTENAQRFLRERDLARDDGVCLATALREVLPRHSGACCVFIGEVIVTSESCRCDGPVKRAHEALRQHDAMCHPGPILPPSTQ